MCGPRNRRKGCGERDGGGALRPRPSALSDLSVCVHLREQQLRRQLAAAAAAAVASFTAVHRRTLHRASDSNEPIILALVGDR